VIKTFKFSVDDSDITESQPLDKYILRDLLEELFSNFHIQLIDDSVELLSQE
jgi:hypothetical protein